MSVRKYTLVCTLLTLFVILTNYSSLHYEEGAFQESPTCDLAIAPYGTSENRSNLKTLEVTENDPVTTRVNLLDLSQNYVNRYSDEVSGALRDRENNLDIRDTAIGALVWAETNDWNRAIAALEFVLANQELDRSSPHYGNFKVHAGDVEPTDNNWSAFIGSYLLVFALRYEASLPSDLLEQISESIRAATHHRLCTRIPIQNTNIALLSAFALIKSGEWLLDETSLSAGKVIWESFVDHTVGAGFAEYNSPNYYKVNLYALGFLSDYVDDIEIRRQANQIRQLLWCSISNRYLLKAQQIAGPYSRTFTDRMAYEFTGMHPFIYRDSGGQFPFPASITATDDNQLHAILPLLVSSSWPDECFYQARSVPAQPYLVRERTRIVVGEPNEVAQQITTYMHPRLALGTVNTGLLTSTQNRSLIAHLVSESDEVGVFKLVNRSPTIVENLWIKSVQNRNSAVVAILLEAPNLEGSLSFEIAFVWEGTHDAPPQIGFDSVNFERQHDTLLMGMPVSLQLSKDLLPEGAWTDFRLSWIDEETAELSIVTTLPSDVDANGKTLIPLVFAVHIPETDVVQPTLNPINSQKIGKSDRTSISWQAPDNSILRLDLPSSEDSYWFVHEFINGEKVEPHPLAYHSYLGQRIRGSSCE